MKLRAWIKQSLCRHDWEWAGSRRERCRKCGVVEDIERRFPTRTYVFMGIALLLVIFGAPIIDWLMPV